MDWNTSQAWLSKTWFQQEKNQAENDVKAIVAFWNASILFEFSVRCVLSSLFGAQDVE